MPNKFKHWFAFASSGVFILFFSIMVYATYIAFSRHSGVAKLDVTKIQKLRYDSEANRLHQSTK